MKRIRFLALVMILSAVGFGGYTALGLEGVAPEVDFKSTVQEYFNDVEKFKYVQTPLEESNLSTIWDRSLELKQFLKGKIKIIQQRRSAFNLNPLLLESKVEFYSCIIDGQNAVIDAVLTEIYQYSSSDIGSSESTRFKFYLTKEALMVQPQIREMYSDDPIGVFRRKGGDVQKLFDDEKRNILSEKKLEEVLEEPIVFMRPLSGSLLSLDRNEMVTYAHNNANTRPSQWGNFDDNGGDCTNFVSQVIYAGSNGVMDSSGDLQWYYNSYNDRAASWTSVSSLFNYLTRNTGRGPQGELATTSMFYYGMQVGDIIQIDFNSDGTFAHSTTIVRFQAGFPTGTLVAAHTSDADNKSINDYVGSKRWIHLTGYER